MIIGNVVALLIMNYIKYGLSDRGWASIWCMTIGATIMPTIIYKSKLSNVWKAIGMNWCIGVACMTYAVIVKQSTNSFLICFVVAAVSTIYYEKKIIIYVGGLLAAIGVVISIFAPEAISGAGQGKMSSLTKAVYFIAVVLISKKATDNGAAINQKSLDTLSELEDTYEKSTQVAHKLNETVIESNMAVQDIVEQVGNI